MRIELPIDPNYLPSWGPRQGIREILQNGRDAAVDGLELDVSYRAATRTLRVTNRGAVLPHESLLIGRSTKRGRRDQAGQHGEGLDDALLVLTRAGYPVKVRSGSEVWTCSIERSDRFDADVLVVNVRDGNADEQRVRVEVGNVSPELWDEVRDLHLFLRAKVNQVKTQVGALLLDPGDRGRIFVKGIWVESDRDLAYGYDLYDIHTDRDRRVLDRWDREQAVKRIWTEAVQLRPDLVADFTALLQDNTADLAGVRDWNATDLPAALLDGVVQTFQQQHGPDALPVSNLGESKDLDHLGRRGVVVPSRLQTVLAVRLGSTETVKEGLKKEVVAHFGWHDLDQVEQDSVVEAVLLVSEAVGGLELDDLDIVTFRSENLLGQFSGGRILLSRSILHDPDETLATIVHEVAHRRGGDGEKDHVAAIEAVWKAIVRNLRNRRTP